jgi:hypothetical protein
MLKYIGGIGGMSKKNVTISVDEFIHSHAKGKGINISAITEEAMRKACMPEIKDIPKESLALKCSQCQTIVEYGFLCFERQKFLCQSCQDNFDMSRCPYNKWGEHEHIRVPGFKEGQNEEYIQNIHLIMEKEKEKKENIE